ncbi:MAG: alpha-amylase/4-alpha-glucanotransferase domain-containing protein [Spirochaetota bacterium]
MKKIKLIFGTHNTQPVGSHDYLFEKAYQEAYKPFLTVLYNFPDFPVTLHYSGILLQWLEDNHPEFLMLLNDMIKRKQVELLGGGFYEPVFSLIPISDRLGQIECLTTFLRKRFGRRPRGSWITESIWEPSFASMLSNSGMDYIFLHDQHFIEAGFTERDLFAPCITEDQGKTLAVYPICRQITERIPSATPEEVVDSILDLRAFEEERVVVVFVSGDKLGLVGNTHILCYKQGWFEKFLTLVIETSEKIEVVNPGRYLKSVMPLKKGYFTCSSCKHLLEWTVSGRLSQSGRSGQKAAQASKDVSLSSNYSFFRQFLTKYPESNLLYSKMIYTQILVNQIRGDKYRKKAAREELWKGQCHDVYWHAQKGGIYSNHLRKAVYYSLIEAEKITREKGIFIPSIISVDFDMDGLVEYLYQGHNLNAYVHVVGGILFELDYLPISWNYLDTLARHVEAYHNDEICNKGNDHYLRKTFIDHFFAENETIEAFDTVQYEELGDFIESLYNVTEYDREHKELNLQRIGSVRYNGMVSQIEILKKYIFKKSSVDVYYVIKNNSEEPITSCFGSEINLALASKGMESTRIYRLDNHKRTELGNERVEVKDTANIVIHDVYNDVLIDISAANNFDLWSLPVETVSKSIENYETIYQSSCLIPKWNITLTKDEKWETRISLRFDKE